MSLKIRKAVQEIFNGYDGREIDELSLVLTSIIRDVRDERIDLDKVKLFFVKNKDAIEALMEIAGMNPEESDEVIRKLVNLVARESAFALGAMIRKYARFSEESYIRETEL